MPNTAIRNTPDGKGIQQARDALKALLTHGGVTEDGDAFDETDTEMNPSGGQFLIKARQVTDIDEFTFDVFIQINGSTEYTDQVVRAIVALTGPAVGDWFARVPRGDVTIQENDIASFGLRINIGDTSPAPAA